MIKSGNFWKQWETEIREEFGVLVGQLIWSHESRARKESKEGWLAFQRTDVHLVRRPQGSSKPAENFVSRPLQERLPGGTGGSLGHGIPGQSARVITRPVGAQSWRNPNWGWRVVPAGPRDERKRRKLVGNTRQSVVGENRYQPLAQSRSNPFAPLFPLPAAPPSSSTHFIYQDLNLRLFIFLRINFRANFLANNHIELLIPLLIQKLILWCTKVCQNVLRISSVKILEKENVEFPNHFANNATNCTFY